MFSIQEKVIKPFGLIIAIDTGITIPKGTYGRIAPRSGLALNHGINVGNAVIDSDFRGKVCVILFNHSSKLYEVEIGDRTVQFILEKIEDEVKIVEVAELPSTERSYKDFGSSGFWSY